MSFGKYLYARGFIQKTALGTTVIHSKQANRRQVIQPTKTVKDNSRRFQKTPRRSLGQKATIVGRLAHSGGRLACHRAHSPLAISYAFLRSTLLILRRFLVGLSNGGRGS